MEELTSKIIEAVEAVLKEYEQQKQPVEAVPAGPLQKFPARLDQIYIADLSGEVSSSRWNGAWGDKCLFEAGRVFPHSPAGKAGAEKRAKAGILPPIDREEFMEKLRKWQDSLSGDRDADNELAVYLMGLLPENHGGGSDE